MPFTILITDDEPIAVESVAQMVKRNFHKEVVVDSCLSGKHAIEKATQIFPDIVIMDIKMFGINGLDAIRRIKDMSISAEFIILSAFDYFDYAQEAISLGVSDYLLKPVDEEKLCLALRKLMNKCSEQTQKRQEYLNQHERLMMSVSVLETSFCNALSLPGEHSGDLERMYELIGCPAGTGGYVVLLQQTEEELSQEKQNINFDIICFQLKRTENCIVGKRKNRIIAYIIFQGCGEGHRKEVERMIASLMRVCLRENVRIVAGLGRYYSDIGNASKSYAEARSALKYRLGTNTAAMDTVAVEWYEDLVDMEGQILAGEEDSGKIEEYMASCLEQANLDTAIQEVDRHISHMQKKELDFDEVKRNMTDIIIRLDRRFSFPIEEVLQTLDDIMKATSMEDLTECMHDAMTWSAQALILRNKKKENDIIERAVAYIAEHYMESISLEQVALSVNLSQHYFSRFFKQEKGINFTDYLTSVRIEHAKKLFAQGVLSIKEVAYQTGFQDPNYFSKKFRLVTGTTPSRFKSC